jgi:hypothetical protein
MTDPVWSVNILISIGLIGTLWCIYKILTLDDNEEKTSSNTHPSKVIDE